MFVKMNFSSIYFHRNRQLLLNILSVYSHTTSVQKKHSTVKNTFLVLEILHTMQMYLIATVLRLHPIVGHKATRILPNTVISNIISTKLVFRTFKLSPDNSVHYSTRTQSSIHVFGGLSPNVSLWYSRHRGSNMKVLKQLE